MDLLTYTRNFAASLRTGAIYQQPLNQQEAVFHRSIGVLLEKAINGTAGVELANDMLSELLAARQESAVLMKKLEEAQKKEEPEAKKKK